MSTMDILSNTVPFTGSWTDPDMSIIREGRISPPAFPTRILGEFWQEWVQQHAEAKSAPVDYVAGPLLAAAAACIGNARWVQPHNGWTEPSVLWIQAIGKPSSGKSPGADPVLSLLRQLEDGMATDFPDIQARHLTLKQEAKEKRHRWEDEIKTAVEGGYAGPQIPRDAIEPDKPLRPRIRVNDCTPEMLGQLLAAHPKGLLFQRDELAGWFGSFDRYGGSGGERALWLEAWGGREYVIDRVKNDGEPIRIPNLSVSVFGGLQPDKLASTLLSDDDDGLQARFLCLWPNAIPLARPQLVPDDNHALMALKRLLVLDMAVDEEENGQPRIIPMTSPAADLFYEWRVEHSKEDGSGMYGSHLGKMPGYVARIALVLEFLWWSASDNAEPPSVSEKAVIAATYLVSDYFKPMAQRAYGDATLPENERLAAALGRWILRDGCLAFNARDVYRNPTFPDISKAPKMKLATGELDDAGWIRPAPARAGGTAGKQRHDFDVNPAVFGGVNV